MADEFDSFDLRTELDIEAFDLLQQGNSDLAFGGSSEQEAEVFGRDISASDAFRPGAFLGGVALANLKFQNQRAERFSRIRSLQQELIEREKQATAREGLAVTERNNVRSNETDLTTNAADNARAIETNRNTVEGSVANNKRTTNASILNNRNTNATAKANTAAREAGANSRTRANIDAEFEQIRVEKAAQQQEDTKRKGDIRTLFDAGFTQTEVEELDLIPGALQVKADEQRAINSATPAPVATDPAAEVVPSIVGNSAPPPTTGPGSRPTLTVKEAEKVLLEQGLSPTRTTADGVERKATPEEILQVANQILNN